MNIVDRDTFELWAEVNEHSPNVMCSSRMMGADFVTEYISSYDNSVIAKVVSTETGESYCMA